MTIKSNIRFVNGMPIDIKKFPGGEVQVTITNTDDLDRMRRVITIEAHIKCSDGVMILGQLKNILDRDFPGFNIHLSLPYVPYARQDRAMVKHDAFSLKVFANFINSLKFARVFIVDPHSDVAPALFDNVSVSEQHEMWGLFGLKDHCYDAVVSPDAGALKKIYKAAKALGVKDIIQASKVRDVETGKLTGTTVEGNFRGKKLLIVDDICDGGGTFTALAKELKKTSPARVDLYVTHGIFSKGIDALTDHIDHVYTQFSWVDSHPKLTAIQQV